MTRRLVLVRWWDAMSDDSGWKTIRKARRMRAPLVRTVGWLVKDTKKRIVLVASLVDGECDGDVVIPRGMVKSIVDLREEGSI